MIGLLQRVSAAHVEVDGVTIGAIGQGLLVLVGVQKGDDETRAERLLQRLLSYRVFADDNGRMNLSLRNIRDGGLLLVPQFTLAADTRKGTRASFTSAARQRKASIYTICWCNAPAPSTARWRADASVRICRCI